MKQSSKVSSLNPQSIKNNKEQFAPPEHQVFKTSIAPRVERHNFGQELAWVSGLLRRAAVYGRKKACLECKGETPQAFWETDY